MCICCFVHEKQIYISKIIFISAWLCHRNEICLNEAFWFKLPHFQFVEPQRLKHVPLPPNSNHVNTKQSQIYCPRKKQALQEAVCPSVNILRHENHILLWILKSLQKHKFKFVPHSKHTTCSSVTVLKKNDRISGPFAKLRKETMSIVMSVRPSAWKY